MADDLKEPTHDEKVHIIESTWTNEGLWIDGKPLPTDKTRLDWYLAHIASTDVEVNGVLYACGDRATIDRLMAEERK